MPGDKPIDMPDTTSTAVSAHESHKKGETGPFSGDKMVAKQQLPEIAPIRWTASQFVAHHKSAQWYAGLVLAGSALAALTYLLTRGDMIATSAMIVAAVFFGIAAARPPRVIQYEVNGKGVTIGRHFFSYEEFKSFATVQEGAILSIVFLPLKRFMPSVTIYCAPETEQQVVSTLSDFLPVHEAHHGLLDHFLDRIRF